MTKRRKFSTSFKKRVALAALRGDKTIQELAAHHQLSPQSDFSMEAAGHRNGKGAL